MVQAVLEFLIALPISAPPLSVVYAIMHDIDIILIKNVPYGAKINTIPNFDAHTPNHKRSAAEQPGRSDTIP